MKKYLRKFENQAAYDTAKPDLNLPSVSLIADTMGCEFDPYVPTPAGPPSDEIWYTSENGRIVEPNDDYVAESLPEILSNTYIDGKGIIKFAENVTSIGNGAFYYCNTLESIEIPRTVTSIGDRAFSDCTLLRTILIPSSVTSIGEYVFAGVNRLKITIEGQLTSIGTYAFTDSGGTANAFLDLTILSTTPFDLVDSEDNVIDLFGEYVATVFQIHVPEGYEDTYATHDEGWEQYANFIVRQVPADEIWYTSEEDVIVNPHDTSALPEIVSNTYENGKGIIKFEWDIDGIGEKAFYECSDLATIALPNVGYIESEAFSGCSNLKSVLFGEGTTDIYDSAFKDCSCLIYVSFPNSINNIGHDIFEGCDNLTTPIYNDYIFAKLTYSFSGRYTIPEGIVKIGDHAFYYSGLTGTLVIPDSVKYIDKNAFEENRQLTTVVLNTGLLRIEDEAFLDCTGITEITIPESVTYLGNDCMVSSTPDSRTLDVTFLSTTPLSLVAGGTVITPFEGEYTPTVLRIHVPAGYEAVYATHDAGWEVLAPYIVGYTPAE